MADKNNKSTLRPSVGKYDIVVKNNNGYTTLLEAKSCNEKVVTAFVTNFYEKHSKVMTKLAYE